MVRVKIAFANGDTEYFDTVDGIQVRDRGVLRFELTADEKTVHLSPSHWQSAEVEKTAYDPAQGYY